MKTRLALGIVATGFTLLCFQNCGNFKSKDSNTGSSLSTSGQFSIVNDQGEYALPAEAEMDENADLKIYLRNSEVLKGEPAKVRLALNKPAEGNVTVSIETFDGSGETDLHFKRLTKKLEIPKGETEIYFDISTLVTDTSTEDVIFGVRIFEASVSIGQDVAGVLILGGHNPFLLQSLSIEYGVACGLDEQGAAWCWGVNDSGQLGLANVESSFLPVKINSSKIYKELRVGLSHICALAEDDTLECWGSDDSGRLGNGAIDGDSLSPSPVVGLVGVKAFDVGFANTCAIDGQDRTYCWGSNVSGRLGIGDPSIQEAQVPMLVNLQGAESLNIGGAHVCAHMTDLTVSCWGSNATQTFGVTAAATLFAPIPIPALGMVKKVTSNLSTICAIRMDDSLVCMGSNSSGLLGLPIGTFNSPIPTEIQGLGSDVLDISLGRNQACAHLRDDSIWCWGSNRYQELGRQIDSIAAGRIAAPVEGFVENVKTVAAGEYFSCYLNQSGEVRCWGGNLDGRLGNSGAAMAQTPFSQKDLDLKLIRRGIFHSCGITNSNQGQCWGSGTNGQLGLGAEQNFAPLPTDLPSLIGVRDIQIGVSYSCAYMSDKTVNCWGNSFYPAIGDGSLGGGSVPQPVIGLGQVRAMAGGRDMACGINESGATVSCWGLLNGVRSPATLVEGLSGVRRISLGNSHACVINQDRTVSCWGTNGKNELGVAVGVGGILSSLVPVKVDNIDDAIEISAGHSHTCVLRRNGFVRCWGSNIYGQLGVGQVGESSVATVDIAGIVGAKQIVSGHNHSCVITSGNRAQCWGANELGQLGDNSLKNSAVPKNVLTLSDVGNITAYQRATLFHIRDGSSRMTGLRLKTVDAPGAQPLSIPK